MNKLFFIPSAAIAALTPILVCTSCGDNPSPSPDAETIAGYIFDPTHLTDTKETTDWRATVLGWTNDEWIAEVYYDLFGWFNWPNLYSIGDVTFEDLYEDNIVGVKTNIGKCVVNVDQSELTINIDFLGYVSFVFIQDYKNENGEIVFKKNDYVMLTYELKNFPIIPISTKDTGRAGFLYQYPIESPLPYCLGFFKVKRVNEEFLNYIKEINTTFWEGVPSNSQNYVKATPPSQN